MIFFHVPAVPVAQPRQRHRIMNVGGRSFAQNYTPTTHPINAFKAAVQLAASAAFQGSPLTGPLMLTATFVLPRHWHDTKPDAENLAKGMMDALTGIVWADDRQVAKALIAKFYASADEQPGVFVQVERLE